jgi:hypothetical protein
MSDRLYYTCESKPSSHHEPSILQPQTRVVESEHPDSSLASFVCLHVFGCTIPSLPWKEAIILCITTSRLSRISGDKGRFSDGGESCGTGYEAMLPYAALGRGPVIVHELVFGSTR